MELTAREGPLKISLSKKLRVWRYKQRYFMRTRVREFEKHVSYDEMYYYYYYYYYLSLIHI